MKVVEPDGEREREVKAREGKQELNKIRETGRVFPQYTCLGSITDGECCEEEPQKSDSQRTGVLQDPVTSLWVWLQVQL